MASDAVLDTGIIKSMLSSSPLALLIPLKTPAFTQVSSKILRTHPQRTQLPLSHSASISMTLFIFLKIRPSNLSSVVSWPGTVRWILWMLLHGSLGFTSHGASLLLWSRFISTSLVLLPILSKASFKTPATSLIWQHPTALVSLSIPLPPLWMTMTLRLNCVERQHTKVSLGVSVGSLARLVLISRLFILSLRHIATSLRLDT